MKLLNKNHYEIVYGNRCNLNCSYCCNIMRRSSVNAHKGLLEKETNQLMEFLNTIESGVILVSGGEPTLWEDLGKIIYHTNHKWIILTNLTNVEHSWIEHKNVICIIPTLHEGMDRKVFVNNIFKLKEKGKRIHAKIIVKPNDLYKDIEVWEELNHAGIPASFIPLEYNKEFSDELKNEIKDIYLTSCIYNGRFFRKNIPRNQPCIAGKKEMFKICPEGNIVRCSRWPSKIGTISKPVFSEKSENCNAEDCFCEWHHWSDVIPNENKRWEEFIKTGVWKNPTKKEFEEFVKKWNMEEK